MFIALEDDDVRVAWLEDELKRERKRAFGHLFFFFLHGAN